MKKTALVLAMVLCLVPVLSACGMHSSPEKVASAAFEAKYIDFDYEDYFDSVYTLDLDLLEDIMGKSDKYESMKDSMRNSRDSVKDSIKSDGKTVDSSEIKKYKVKYDVRYSETYKKDSEMYDLYMNNFAYSGTDYEDVVKKVAVVGIAAETYVTDEDGNEYVSGKYFTIVCYNIDGDWYASPLS